MSTVFFQIYMSAFFEAAPISDHPSKSHGLRIVSIDRGREHFVNLAPVNLDELKIIVNILGLRYESRFRHFDDVRSYWSSIGLYR